jgi:hypothetical protein
MMGENNKELLSTNHHSMFVTILTFSFSVSKKQVRNFFWKLGIESSLSNVLRCIKSYFRSTNAHVTASSWVLIVEVVDCVLLQISEVCAEIM